MTEAVREGEKECEVSYWLCKGLLTRARVLHVHWHRAACRCSFGFEGATEGQSRLQCERSFELFYLNEPRCSPYTVGCCACSLSHITTRSERCDQSVRMLEAAERE